MSEPVDLLVIGAGPGGYVAAIRAAQLGMKVVVVDRRSLAGGTCLNIGCIPSKALLYSSHKFWDAKNHLATHGVMTDSVRLDLKRMLARKDAVVEELTQGISFLFRKNEVTFIQGDAQIVHAGKVKVTKHSGNEEIWHAKNILIATGSEPTIMPGVEIDEERVITSTGALSLSKVPKNLVVIGAGYIGLELGSVWARLGSKVTVIEYLDRLAPTMDHEVGNALQKALTSQGLLFKFNRKVIEIIKKAKEIDLHLLPADEDQSHKPGEYAKPEIIACDVVLMSIGRRPLIHGLGLENVDIIPNERGFIEVDDNYATSCAGIYAIGDVIPGPMLAHKAEEEGIAVAENLAGQAGHVNYDVIPAVIYTSPEVASVGKTEEQLKEEHVDYAIGKFPFAANSRAKAVGDTTGFVKVLTDKATDRVLGVHIIGEVAGTMIAEAALAMEFGASAEDIARTCHAHPTHSEALKEAAMAAYDKPIHI